MNHFAQSLDLTDEMEDAIHEVIQHYGIRNREQIITALTNLADRAEGIADEYSPASEQV